MIWLLTRLVVWPVRAALLTAGLAARTTGRTATGSAKLGFRAGRLVGYRRLGVLLVGVVVGLLVAPVPGRELRARLTARLQGDQPASAPTTSAPTAFPDAGVGGGRADAGPDVAPLTRTVSDVVDGEVGADPAP
jgi:hypothetical protein